MQLFKDQYCSIEFYAKTSILEVTWLSQPDMDYFVACFDRCLVIAEEQGVKYVLADSFIGIHLDVATQRRVIEHGALQIEQLGILKYARVVPLDVFQEIVSYKIADETFGLIPGKTQFRVFSSRTTARAWLLERSGNDEEIAVSHNQFE